MHYAGSADANLALFPKPDSLGNVLIGLGDSIWFRGDFYLPPNVNDTPGTSMRKLNYWGAFSGNGFPHVFAMVLTLQGSQLEVDSWASGTSNTPADYAYLPVFVTKGIWHKLEIQLKINSTFAAKDGILRIWLDGAQVYNRTDMRWSDPLWTENPSTYKWSDWGIGYQMQSSTAYDEYRYWDNVTFSKTRQP